MKKTLLLLMLFAVGFASCDKDEQRYRDDRKKILQYIQKNNLNAIEADYGLFYVIEEEGEGEHPHPTALMRVHYKGYLLDGSVFDETDLDGSPAQLRLSQMIHGWKIGMPYFKPGGKGKLLIPSNIGYGARSFGIIPAYSVLIFDIELISFE
jgi:FKBP-type peptidyl-prolyl cis-trans isomerase FkpA